MAKTNSAAATSDATPSTEDTTTAAQSPAEPSGSEDEAGLKADLTEAGETFQTVASDALHHLAHMLVHKLESAGAVDKLEGLLAKLRALA